MKKFAVLLLVLWSALPASAGEKWAVLIGVDRYETKQITPLNYAVRDVSAVGKVLEKTGVPKKNIFLLTDKGKGRSLATGTNIVWRMSWLAKRLKVGDTLFFYFSGHGLEKEGETYLLSYDSDIGNSVTLKRTAVRMSELRELSKSMKASNVITFMDACRNNPEAGKSVGAPNVLSKGMARDLALVGSGPGKQKTLNVTFYSCSPGERSWESEETSQGFFSFHVMKGLLGEAADEQGRITVNSLEDYLSREVPDSVDRMIGQQQTPWTRREGTAGGGFVIARGKKTADAQVPQLNSQAVASVRPTAPASEVPQSNSALLELPASPWEDPLPWELPPLSEIEAKANSGDVNGQYQLGIYYYYGRGGTWDKAAANEWLTKASDAGHQDAQRILANPSTLRELAESGYPGAMSDMASRLSVGYLGFEQDKAAGLAMYRRAAQAGSISALGYLYSNAPDNTEEKRYYRESLKAWLRQVESNPNSWGLQETWSGNESFWRRKRLEFFLRLAAQGDLSAASEAGAILTAPQISDAGEVTYRSDVGRGIQLLKDAAPKYPAAAFSLGLSYCTGAGGRVSKKKARRWFEHAANLDPEAYADLSKQMLESLDAY